MKIYKNIYMKSILVIMTRSVIFNIQIKTFFIKINGGKIVMVVFFSEIYVVLTMTFMYTFSL